MATILRGKNRGRKVVINQWCNDWVSAIFENKPKIFSLSALKFSEEEMNKILNHNNNGIMFQLFTPCYELGLFKRKKRQRG